MSKRRVNLVRRASAILSFARKRFGGQALFDSFAWILALFVATFLRFEFDFSNANPGVITVLGLAAAGLNWLIGRRVGLYKARYRTGSFDESVALSVSAAGTTFALSAAVIVWGPAWGIPRSIVLIAAPIFVVSSALVRALRRLRIRRASAGLGQKPAIIFGAGQLAELFIPQLLADRSGGYTPVALVDDDPGKANRWISGVKMMGQLNDLPRVASRVGAKALIVAIAGVDAPLLARVRDISAPLGLEVSVLPSPSEIISAERKVFSLRELGIEDLVGRRAVSVDPPAIESYLHGRTVLVTGAGGSIGVELCRQALRYSPARLIFLDRDETGLQTAQLATSGSGLLSDMDFALADIRDADAIGAIFESAQPDVVFHAAALKHLPALERFPEEAWKTNVLGTANILAAAGKAGVGHFVNISTDKAAGPESVLGRSKKIAEELTAWYSEQLEGNFHSVRFGNVLGSRGSLVPTLRYLIEAGQPISITHPEATRFFMTIPEACQLVLQAGAEEARSSILVLDMGEPVKIMTIAEKMVELSGKSIEITISGLRPGEKLHEELSSANEELVPSSHARVWKLLSPQLDPDHLYRVRDSFGL